MRARWAGAALLWALMAPAVAHAGGGAISGTVREASTHTPLQGIEVCAYTLDPSGGETDAESPGEGEYGCATSGASGEYTIGGLNAGAYAVEFGLPLTTSLNYVAQLYDGKSIWEQATPVTVAEGATTNSIDAELEPGAELSGTVTNAATGAGLEGAFVCAIMPTGGETGAAVSCTRSVAGGAFTLTGVPAGTLDVGTFYATGEEYGLAYLGGATVLSEAKPIAVAAREVRSGLNLALTLKSLPVKSGSPSGGGSPGSPGTAGAPGTGSSSAPKHAAARGLSLASTRIAVDTSGDARIEITCSGASACSGRLALRQRETVKQGSHRRTRTVVIGGAAYSLAPGHRRTLLIRLSPAGRRELRARHGRLPFHVSIAQANPAPAVVSVKDVVLVSARG